MWITPVCVEIPNKLPVDNMWITHKDNFVFILMMYEFLYEDGLFFDFTFYFFDQIGQILVIFYFVFYFFTGVHNGCIMFASKMLTNLRKGKISKVSHQIHGNLTRKSDVIGFLR